MELIFDYNFVSIIRTLKEHCDTVKFSGAGICLDVELADRILFAIQEKRTGVFKFLVIPQDLDRFVKVPELNAVCGVFNRIVLDKFAFYCQFPIMMSGLQPGIVCFECLRQHLEDALGRDPLVSPVGCRN